MLRNRHFLFSDGYYGKSELWPLKQKKKEGHSDLCMYCKCTHIYVFYILTCIVTHTYIYKYWLVTTMYYVDTFLSRVWWCHPVAGHLAPQRSPPGRIGHVDSPGNPDTHTICKTNSQLTMRTLLLCVHFLPLNHVTTKVVLPFMYSVSTAALK